MIKVEKFSYDIESVSRFIDLPNNIYEISCTATKGNPYDSRQFHRFNPKKDYVLISHHRENWYWDWDVTQVRVKQTLNFCIKKRVPLERIIIVHPNKVHNICGFTHVEFDGFEVECYHRHIVKKEIIPTTPRENADKFLSLNGKPNKPGRGSQIKHLERYGLINRGIVTLLGDDRYPSVDNIDYTKNEYGEHYLGYPYDTDLYRNTKFSVVAETHVGKKFNRDTFWPTEKIYRAIINHHPFVVLSTKDFLYNLREKGYKTFYEIWDEMYDTMEDFDEREKHSLNLIPIIFNIEKDKYCDIVKHNYNTLIRNSKSSLEKLRNMFYD